jgi:hypothetical protein
VLGKFEGNVESLHFGMVFHVNCNFPLWIRSNFYQKSKNTRKARKEKEQRRNEKLVAVECDKKNMCRLNLVCHAVHEIVTC